jgi:two-component system, OmpR family, sensor histidine kinase QseC
LVLARLESNVPAPWTPVDIANLIRDCLAAHAGIADNHGVELSYSGPDSLISVVPPDGLKPIVENLVGNAIRYNTSGGHVEVRLDESAPSLIGLFVTDDGPGISQDQRKRVFERFHRGPAVTQTGSGLGLAIAAAAAHQLGATMTILDGSAGRGVRFVVRWRRRKSVP